jgi:hypothetical protein
MQSSAADSYVPALIGTSPIDILYAHALESIFIFFNLLHELSIFMCVNHRWQSAVLTMPPCALRICRIDSALTANHILPLCTSRLRRHVSHIGDEFPSVPLPIATVNTLAHCMTHILSMSVTINYDKKKPLTPLTFPHKLQQLRLRCNAFNSCKPPDAAQFCQNTLENISNLTALRELNIQLVHFVSWTPLARLTQLHSLELMSKGDGLDQLYSLIHLRTLRILYPTPLLSLLQPRNQSCLHLQVLGAPSAMKQEEINALTTLALTLHTLSIDLFPGVVHVDFLQSMINMRSVVIHMVETIHFDGSRMLTALHGCRQLTSLDLSSNRMTDGGLNCTSEGLAALLPCLPHLQSLSLQNVGSLSSLSFLTTGPITSTLTELQFRSCSPPLSINQFSCFEALRSLTTLDTSNVFDRDLTSEESLLYEPPSALIPSLTYFYSCQEQMIEVE